MKKSGIALFLILIFLITATITSCEQTPNYSNESIESSSAAEDISDSTSNTSQAEETESENEYVFGEPKSSELNINSGTFYKTDEIEEDYIVKKADGFTYINIFSPVIEISGFPYLEENDNQLYRLKLSDKDKYSDANQWLAWCTAGGKVRFRTSSTVLKVEITLHNTVSGMKHFADTGSKGIDVYVGTGTARKYNCTIQPLTEPSYSGTVYLNSGIKEVMINLPNYSGVKSMSIGFQDGTTVALPLPYTYEKPIVFYGSSITQGGCSSRPGTAYFNILTRALDANTVNLGFSGSAFGETSIAEYIASIEMSAFVFDYDYNADTKEKLEATHYPFYKIVREAHPDIPIIFVSRCNYDKYNTKDVEARLLIMENYEKVKAEGDENVYFVDGSTFFDKYNPGDFTVDGLHPTDLGFRMMAEKIYPVLKQALEKAN